MGLISVNCGRTVESFAPHIIHQPTWVAMIQSSTLMSGLTMQLAKQAAADLYQNRQQVLRPGAMSPSLQMNRIDKGSGSQSSTYCILGPVLPRLLMITAHFPTQHHSRSVVKQRTCCCK
jgi:hypothetical protein